MLYVCSESDLYVRLLLRVNSRNTIIYSSALCCGEGLPYCSCNGYYYLAGLHGYSFENDSFRDGSGQIEMSLWFDPLINVGGGARDQWSQYHNSQHWISHGRFSVPPHPVHDCWNSSFRPSYTILYTDGINLNFTASVDKKSHQQPTNQPVSEWVSEGETAAAAAEPKDQTKGTDQNSKSIEKLTHTTDFSSLFSIGYDDRE